MIISYTTFSWTVSTFVFLFALSLREGLIFFFKAFVFFSALVFLHFVFILHMTHFFLFLYSPFETIRSPESHLVNISILKPVSVMLIWILMIIWSEFPLLIGSCLTWTVFLFNFSRHGVGLFILISKERTDSLWWTWVSLDIGLFSLVLCLS